MRHRLDSLTATSLPGARGTRLLLFAATLALVQAAVALEPRQLGWSDLMPEALVEAGREVTRLQRHITSLPDEQRRTYETVAEELLLREQLAAGLLDESTLSQPARDILSAGLSERHPEVTRYLMQVKAARERANTLSSATEPSLNGQLVRIPGYVLPLDFDGTRVREFLLVPFVGACIHVPAPPPNQMVLVQAAESFEVGGLYEPVWVEGTLSTQGETRNLSLVDGEAPVDAGYSLGATRVTPYTQ